MSTLKPNQYRLAALWLARMPRFDDPACAGQPLEWWFPPEGTLPSESRYLEDKAKSVCVACPALDECRLWALEHPGFASDGVWGGLSASQRRTKARRSRRERSKRSRPQNQSPR